MAEFDEFRRRREATIRFSDVFGEPPINGSPRLQPLHDFDAHLTDQVRQVNRFIDAQYGIGSWPATGDYAAVLLEQLRAEQITKANRLGLVSGAEIDENDLHPDDITLLRSLGGAVVAVINHAPRTDEHRIKHQNGDGFYAGVTTSEVEIYGQLAFFRGLNARGFLKSFYEIPEKNPIWVPGEQFRSSFVSQARQYPEILEPKPLSEVPALDLEGRVAYADKFGNVRLEIAQVEQFKELLTPGNAVRLTVDGKDLGERIGVYNELPEIPEDQLGLYHNPSEERVEAGVAYYELARRVSGPNNNHNHAYSTLALTASRQRDIISPSDWERIEIQILPYN